jgi:hypothetical protein
MQRHRLSSHLPHQAVWLFRKSTARPWPPLIWRIMSILKCAHVLIIHRGPREQSHLPPPPPHTHTHMHRERGVVRQVNCLRVLRMAAPRGAGTDKRRIWTEAGAYPVLIPVIAKHHHLSGSALRKGAGLLRAVAGSVETPVPQRLVADLHARHSQLSSRLSLPLQYEVALCPIPVLQRLSIARITNTLVQIMHKAGQKRGTNRQKAGQVHCTSASCVKLGSDPIWFGVTCHDMQSLTHSHNPAFIQYGWKLNVARDLKQQVVSR